MRGFLMDKRKIDLLREFVDFTCEECHRHEDIVGKLVPHRIKQGGEYSLRNVKMICNYKGKINKKFSCHEIFSSAQRIANGTQS
jgi:hypothetical protein